MHCATHRHARCHGIGAAPQRPVRVLYACAPAAIGIRDKAPRSRCGAPARANDNAGLRRPILFKCRSPSGLGRQKHRTAGHTALLPLIAPPTRICGSRLARHDSHLQRDAPVRRQYARGFTLVEMMIILAIVGVLAAMAIPAYQNYVARAKVSEGLILAQPLRHAVVEYIAINGGLPQVENNTWNLILDELGVANDSESGAASGAYVKRIWWNNNADHPGIRIKYDGGALDDRLLYLQANISAGVIAWECTAPSSRGVPDSYLPARCR